MAEPLAPGVNEVAVSVIEQLPEIVRLYEERKTDILLAYEMNAQPLPTAFGAPLRLRLEGQLGYKMVKWVRSMELIGSYDDIGLGYGGWRADRLHYSRLAPI